MLVAAALEILDSADLRQVLDHVSSCAECGQLLPEYREVAAALAGLLPPRRLDPARSALLRARLIARTKGDFAGGKAEPKAATLVPRPLRAAFIVDRLAGWVAAAVLASVLLVHHGIHRPLDYGWVAAGAIMIAFAAVSVYARVLRGQVSALRTRVSELESRTTPPKESTQR